MAPEMKKKVCVCGCIRAFLWDWPSAAKWMGTALPIKQHGIFHSNGIARSMVRRGTSNAAARRIPACRAVRSERAWMPFLFFRSSLSEKREFFFFIFGTPLNGRPCERPARGGALKSASSMRLSTTVAEISRLAASGITSDVGASITSSVTIMLRRRAGNA